MQTAHQADTPAALQAVFRASHRLIDLSDTIGDVRTQASLIRMATFAIDDPVYRDAMQSAVLELLATLGYADEIVGELRAA